MYCNVFTDIELRIVGFLDCFCDPVFENPENMMFWKLDLFLFLEYWTKDTAQNPVIPSVMCHLQDPLESKCKVV
jgi:hypothetical protein